MTVVSQANIFADDGARFTPAASMGKPTTLANVGDKDDDHELDNEFSTADRKGAAAESRESRRATGNSPGTDRA